VLGLEKDTELRYSGRKHGAGGGERQQSRKSGNIPNQGPFVVVIQNNGGLYANNRITISTRDPN
jgi:hypothetical protein